MRAKIAPCFASYGLTGIVTKTCNFEAASSRSSPKTTTHRRTVSANKCPQTRYLPINYTYQKTSFYDSKSPQNHLKITSFSYLRSVRKNENTGVDIEIDELTNSIRNLISGDSFSTDITRITKVDLKKITKKEGWLFDWKLELKHPEREVYKLTIVNNQSIIQGLISLEVRSDHVFMHLVESAPFNKRKTKLYSGVPGNLVAFSCKLSFQRGHDGNVAFISKTQLIDHYTETLGAIHVGGRLMIIDSHAAHALINRYFSNL